MGLFKDFFNNRQQIRAISDRLETLEREQKALEMEWTEVYDKLRHMMGRVAKRAERAERALGGTNGDSLESSEAPPHDAISEAVWARRRRGRLEAGK